MMQFCKVAQECHQYIYNQYRSSECLGMKGFFSSDVFFFQVHDAGIKDRHVVHVELLTTFKISSEECNIAEHKKST